MAANWLPELRTVINGISLAGSESSVRFGLSSFFLGLPASSSCHSCLNRSNSLSSSVRSIVFGVSGMIVGLPRVVANI